MKIVNTIKRIIILNNAIKRTTSLYFILFNNENVTNVKLDALEEISDKLYNKLDSLKKDVKTWRRDENITKSERIARGNQLEITCKYLSVKWYNL